MSKLDPNQVFVVQSFRRQDIATVVNSMIKSERWDIRPFAEDDERLTDEFCTSFVEATEDTIVAFPARNYIFQRACVSTALELSCEEDEDGVD